LAEISAEEMAAFEDWRSGRENRKVSSNAKRKAATELKSKYFAEYQALVVKFGGKKPKAKAA